MTEKQFFNSLTSNSRLLLGIHSVIISSKKSPLQIAEFLDISINGANLILSQLNHHADLIDKLYKDNVCEVCE